MFLTSTDFIGYYQIAKPNSHQIGELQSYIDSVEPSVLRDLLGCELYDLFIADLVSGVPQSARFTAIFNAFNLDDGDCQYRSLGIKEMLKGFVYYSYVRDSDYFNTISGNVKNNFANSTGTRGVQYGLDERYNVSLDTYDTIQWYINENITNYPEYNGLNKEVKVWF